MKPWLSLHAQQRALERHIRVDDVIGNIRYFPELDGVTAVWKVKGKSMVVQFNRGKIFVKTVY